MELSEKQFIAGFNSGYLLAEYEPKMLNVLLKNIQRVNSYISGMTYGQKKYEQDNSKTNLNELHNIRHKGKEEINRELI